MSEVKTNKLTGTSTAGSIAVTGEGNSTTTNLQQGLAKVWVSIDGTGTLATRDSFNVASVSDDGTGDYRTTFTSAIANDDYACPLGTAVGNDFLDNTDMTSGAITVKTFSVAGSQGDTDPITFCVMGDLA